DARPARQRVSAADAAHRGIGRRNLAAGPPPDYGRGGPHAPPPLSGGRQCSHRRAPIPQYGRPAAPGGRVIQSAREGDYKMIKSKNPQTLVLHGGNYRSDPATGSVAVPIYQTTAYQF